MGITSINLSTIPFMSSCDSTRAQMAAKQMSQSLTHPNCEIPYVISSDYPELTNNSHMGICRAIDDGEIVFHGNEIVVIYYRTLDKFETKAVPSIKKTTGTFASTLRFCLSTGTKFRRGDAIFSYDCFRDCVPSFGYNAFTGYFTFFGYNHEDGLTISESFADKARHKFTETVYIPVFEYTVLQQMYADVPNSLLYFPNEGQQIREDIVCTKLQPKLDGNSYTCRDLKHRMMVIMKSMSVSDLLSVGGKTLTAFSIDPIKTKIPKGTVSGIKVHKLKKNVELVDARLQAQLEKLWKTYIEHYLIDTFGELSSRVGSEYTKNLTKEYLVYKDDPSIISNRKDLKKCAYLIELEISQEHKTELGDKLCNRYANKGVISLILPDELRPIAVQSQKPIDVIFNPFGVFSRMNLSQILEGMVAKNVMGAEQYIRDNPDDMVETLRWMKNSIIKHFNDEPYFHKCRQLIHNLEKSPERRDEFLQSVNDNNLFIEAPSFSEIDTKKIFKNSVPPNEDVLIPKETIKYLKQKMKVDVPFRSEDTTLKNIFCSPIYIMKLYKLASHIISARDLGPCKHVTKQPLKGRAQDGGSRVGQMELEGIISHGCNKALKEILTVKSDFTEGKKDLISQLVTTGKYDFPQQTKVEGGTKKVVTTLIEYSQM